MLCAAGRAPGAVRRADHLQRQGLRPAAARNALPHGRSQGRRASVRPHGAPGPAVRRAPPVEAAPGKLPPGGSGKPDSGRGAPGRSAGRDDPVLSISNTCAPQQAFELVPIFHHNAIDILSLACLTAIVPLAFRSPGDGGAAARRRFDWAGALAAAGRAPRRSARLFRRAVDMGLPDDLLFRTLWDIAALEKRLGREDAALAVDDGTGRQRAIRTARARSKNWPSTTSIASAITPWRWR